MSHESTEEQVLLGPWTQLCLAKVAIAGVQSQGAVAADREAREHKDLQGDELSGSSVFVSELPWVFVTSCFGKLALPWSSSLKFVKGKFRSKAPRALSWNECSRRVCPARQLTFKTVGRPAWQEITWLESQVGIVQFYAPSGQHLRSLLLACTEHACS